MIVVILVIIRDPSSRTTSSVVTSVLIGSSPSGCAVDGGCFAGGGACFDMGG